MKGHETAPPKLGFPDRQPISCDVGKSQAQRLRDSQPGASQQCKQSRVSVRSQCAAWLELSCGFNEVVDLSFRVNVRGRRFWRHPKSSPAAIPADHPQRRHGGQSGRPPSVGASRCAADGPSAAQSIAVGARICASFRSPAKQAELANRHSSLLTVMVALTQPAPYRRHASGFVLWHRAANPGCPRIGRDQG
jgi:hypothetical protein